jgi:hypothetical protein
MALGTLGLDEAFSSFEIEGSKLGAAAFFRRFDRGL